MPAQPTGAPLRVAQFIGSMKVGGAENLTVRLANALAAAGHDSHVIVASEPGPLSARLRPEVRAHYLHYQRESITRPLAFGWSLKQGLGTVREVIASERIQLVQTHLPGANFWGLLMELGRQCAVIATVHSTREFDYGEASGPSRELLRKLAYRAILRLAHGVVAVSQPVKDALLEQLGESTAIGERITVIDNGVPIPSLATDAERSRARQQYQVSAEPLLVGAGRLTAAKSFGDLLDAFDRVRRAGLDARLVLAGDGEDRAALQAHANRLGVVDQVIFAGQVDAMDELMAAADALVISSRYEGLPLVALEAMAAGVPVISYDLPSLRAVIDDGETGLLATAGDPGALANAITGALEDRPRLRSIADAGRQLIIDRYSLDRTASAVIELYRQVLT
ncbi:MAG: glycosyltransferase [Deltaproteobacteria bacterium]|nr:glycosyltransferase [Deltaproteobacteria bacterium]